LIIISTPDGIDEFRLPPDTVAAPSVHRHLKINYRHLLQKDDAKPFPAKRKAPKCAKNVIYPATFALEEERLKTGYF